MRGMRGTREGRDREWREWREGRKKAERVEGCETPGRWQWILSDAIEEGRRRAGDTKGTVLE